MKKLTNKKKELLKDFCDYTCEMCHKTKTSEELQIHRINRGYLGGEYLIRNIMIICNVCHKLTHYKEFK